MTELCLHLRLDSFKTQPCPKNCVHISCSFFHNLADRRRPLSVSPYSKFICPKAEKCLSKQCRRAHNFTEQVYHPENYKKKYCKNLIKKGHCHFGDVCAYVHSDRQLKSFPLHLVPENLEFMLFRFKSVFCPFWHEHDKLKCVYAHNWQDFKRPFNSKLQPKSCPFWDRKKHLENYIEGCALGFDCVFCHGWKELEFHPLSNQKGDCQSSACAEHPSCWFRTLLTSDPFDFKSDRFAAFSKSIVYNKTSTLDYLEFVDVKLAKSIASNSTANSTDSPFTVHSFGDPSPETRTFGFIHSVSKRGEVPALTKGLKSTTQAFTKNPSKNKSFEFIDDFTGESGVKPLRHPAGENLKTVLKNTTDSFKLSQPSLDAIEANLLESVSAKSQHGKVR